MTPPARQIRQSQAGEWAFMTNAERAERRRNSRLYEEEFEVVDDTAVQVAEERLAAIDDLRSAGFVVERPLWMKQSTYRKVSDMGPAEQSMTGRSTGTADRTERDEASVPVPITFKDFEIDRRDLEAARQTDATIETDDVSAATRQVVELLEDNLINGGGPTLSGNQIEGYTSFGDRNTISKGAGSSWDDLTDLTTILDHVLEMVQAVEDVDQGGGPWWLYIPTEFFTVVSKDHESQAGSLSVLERLQQIPQLQMIRFVDKLAVNNVVLVKGVREVVDLVVASDVDVIDRMTDIDFLIEMKVWAAMAPRLKSDYNGNSGIVHMTLQD